MEVSQLIQKVFTKPIPAAPVPGGNPLSPFTTEPKPSKRDMFDPFIMAEAQKTFAAGDGHVQGSPQGGQPPGQGTNTPTKGTVGNMIPPGWSSQSNK